MQTIKDSSFWVGQAMQKTVNMSKVIPSHTFRFLMSWWHQPNDILQERSIFKNNVFISILFRVFVLRIFSSLSLSLICLMNVVERGCYRWRFPNAWWHYLGTFGLVIPLNKRVLFIFRLNMFQNTSKWLICIFIRFSDTNLPAQVLYSR